jgi:hypothetical protein
MLANGFREEGKELTNDLVELPEFSSQKIEKAAFSACFTARMGFLLLATF